MKIENIKIASFQIFGRFEVVTAHFYPKNNAISISRNQKNAHKKSHFGIKGSDTKYLKKRIRKTEALTLVFAHTLQLRVRNKLKHTLLYKQPIFSS